MPGQAGRFKRHGGSETEKFDHRYTSDYSVDSAEDGTNSQADEEHARNSDLENGSEVAIHSEDVVHDDLYKGSLQGVFREMSSINMEDELDIAARVSRDLSPQDCILTFTEEDENSIIAATRPMLGEDQQGMLYYVSL
jgi:hypothetical protein